MPAECRIGKVHKSVLDDKLGFYRETATNLLFFVQNYNMTLKSDTALIIYNQQIVRCKFQKSWRNSL